MHGDPTSHSTVSPVAVPRRKGWRVGLAACALLAAPAVGVLSYQRQFGLGPQVAVLGWLFLSAAWAAGAALAGIVAITGGRRRRTAATLALAAGLFVVGSGSAIILTGAAASQSLWGDVLTSRMAVAFARYPGAAIDFLPMARSSRTAFAAGGAAAFALLLLLATLAAVSLAGGIVSSVTRWLQADPGHHRRRLLGALIALVLVLSATGIVWLITARPAEMRREPFTGFFELVPVTSVSELDSVRLAAAVEDRASLAGYPRAPAFTRRHVVLVMADALRADRMGVYGYQRDTTPFLSDLFARGRLHRVEMALSTCSESFCGIGSTLASRPFHEISVYNHTLQRVLKSVGYRVLFFLTGDHRGWNYLFDFYGDSIDRVFDHQTMGPAALTDDRTSLAALDALGADDGTPTFFYFFLMSSHMVSVTWPGHDRFQPATLDFAQVYTFWNELAGTTRIGDPVQAAPPIDDDLRERVSNRYDNGVQQADAALARLFSILAAKGYLDDATVVILGDHGDGLGEHGHIGHTRYLYQEDIRIPLLVYDSDLARYRNAAFATQIDVAPTILERLGLPVPAGWRGQSLLRAPSERVTIHQTRRGAHPCAAAIERTDRTLFKFVRCNGGERPVADELYDLGADPGERRNLAASRPDYLRRLKREVEARFSVIENTCQRIECR